MIKNLKKIHISRLFHVEKITKQMLYAVVFISLIALNIVLSVIPIRLDVSKGQAYTLSKASRNILKGINKSATITFYASSDVPTRLLPVKRDVTDLLNEYKKAGGSKIRVEVLDPKKDQKASERARGDGLPELQFSQVNQNQYAVTNSFFGITIATGDKKELLPQATDVGSLEYNISAALYKLTRKENPKIGFVGIDESLGQDPAQTLKRVLSQQFAFDNVDLSTSADNIDPQYKTLLVFGTKEYATDEAQKINNYLKAGGSAMLFMNGIAVNLNNLTAQDIPNNFSAILNDWGIALNPDFVLSRSSELVSFGNEAVSYLIPYPYWVKTGSFNEKASYFSNVNQLTYPWASSLSIGNKEGIEVRDLVKTGKQSWMATSSASLNPQSILSPQEKDLKEFIISAEAKAKNGGKLLVIPSTSFIFDRFMSRSSDNLEFILNVVNDYASGGALSGIRQRQVSFYPLPDIPESQKDTFRYLTILLLPTIFGIYGITRFAKRRKQT